MFCATDSPARARRNAMSPEEIKAKVQDAFTQAMKNRFVEKSRSSHDLFRDVKLYGCEAGADFVNTHLEAIVEEAVETAGCKQESLEMMVHGSGKAAIQGLAEALTKATSLTVEVKNSSVRLIWAESNLGLV
jgi:aconitase B